MKKFIRMLLICMCISGIWPVTVSAQERAKEEVIFDYIPGESGIETEANTMYYETEPNSNAGSANAVNSSYYVIGTASIGDVDYFVFTVEQRCEFVAACSAEYYDLEFGIYDVVNQMYTQLPQYEYLEGLYWIQSFKIILDPGVYYFRLSDPGAGHGYASNDYVFSYSYEVVEAAPNAPSGSLFTDVMTGDYFYDSVLWAVQNGITTGMSPTIFDPNSGCTRGQAVTFLWRAAGSPVVSANNPFVDVAPGSYYYDAVLWAVANGITNGVSANAFAPNDTCTREQIVTFLWRTEGQPITTAINPFVDVHYGDYYYYAVLWAVQNEITTGWTPTEFAVGDVCTRAQIVTFLYRSKN